MAVYVSNSFKLRATIAASKLDTAIEFRSGARYDGDLRENTRDGFGTFFWPNGDKYEGEYKNNKRDGRGKQSWSDGEYYEGSYETDRRHGWGVYYWTNGDKYEGTFYNDHRHGRGRYTWADGTTFTGTFYLDRKEGYGILKYTNGDLFEGLYRRDEREGPGVLTYADGEQDVGFWRREKLIRLLTELDNGYTLRKFENYAKLLDSRPRGEVTVDQSSEDDVLFALLGDVVRPPEALDYDPQATNNVKEKARSSLIKNNNITTDIKSEGFHGELTDNEFLNLSQTEERPDSGISIPSFADPIHSLPAWNATPSNLAMQAHILRFSCLQPKPSSTCDFAAILNGVRSKFGAPGPLERLSTKLLHLCRDGGGSVVQRSIRNILQSKTVSPSVADRCGRTPLLEATVNWHTAVVNILLDAGADINQLSDEGLSPLGACLPFAYPKSGFIRNLADNNIRLKTIHSVSVKKTPEITTKKSPTAAAKKVTSPPQQNLEKNVIEDEDNETQSTQESSKAASKVNKENDKPPAGSDAWEYETPADTAALYSQAKVAKDLGTESDEESIDPVTSCVNADCAINHSGDDFDSRRSLLNYPIAADDSVTIKAANSLSTNERFSVLKDRPASVSEGRVRQMAGEISKRVDMLEMIKHLLKRGADPNVCDVPIPGLFFLIRSADVEMVRQFILKGANVNTQLPREQGGGLCPLHVAVGLPGDAGVHITELLLNALAFPDCRAEVDESFIEPSLGDDWKRDLISPELEAILGGKTPLHLACAKDKDVKRASKIVRLLLSHHANPNLICNGHTPLTLTIACGNDAAMDDLLKHGANPSLSLTHGVGNALSVASSTLYEFRRSLDSRISMLHQLVDSGADILAPVSIGAKRQSGTAVDYAYHMFGLDRRVAHLPYHALSTEERETFNSRKRMLTEMGTLLRVAAVEMEKKKLGDLESDGVLTCSPSPSFAFTGAGAQPEIPLKVAKDQDIDDNMSFVKAGADILTRKPTFKYCYECGRSVGVRLTACTRCKEVYYCSKICKLKAWNARHKEECVRVGGRVQSGKSRGDHSRIDSPTPATNPDFFLPKPNIQSLLGKGNQLKREPKQIILVEPDTRLIQMGVRQNTDTEIKKKRTKKNSQQQKLSTDSDSVKGGGGESVVVLIDCYTYYMHQLDGVYVHFCNHNTSPEPPPIIPHFILSYLFIL